VSGKIILIATPIGNLGDMSGRALETLRQLEVIVAEKPQHSRALMQAFQLGPKRWLRLSAHNENAPRELEKIVEIARSQDVGVVTDAGSPCVSDPGARLVALAFEKGISVTALPGASSAVMAYQLSGFWRSRGFSFHGFLDKWKDSDLTRLETQPCRPWTHVFFCFTPSRGQGASASGGGFSQSNGSAVLRTDENP
jgi:16S rRNA (cytidine1402-2'-O)-methyltransferase